MQRAGTTTASFPSLDTDDAGLAFYPVYIPGVVFGLLRLGRAHCEGAD
jgi:hypothetical protein